MDVHSEMHKHLHVVFEDTRFQMSNSKHLNGPYSHEYSHPALSESPAPLTGEHLKSPSTSENTGKSVLLPSQHLMAGFSCSSRQHC